MLFVSVARQGKRYSLTTPNGIEAEEGARSKTLRILASSSVGSVLWPLVALAEGVAGSNRGLFHSGVGLRS